MRLKRRFFSALCLLGTILIAGCSHPPSNIQVSVLPSGYSCLVANHRAGDYVGSAWARHLFAAKKLALKRCRTNSRVPNACRVRSCRWVKGAPISENGYFTCYAKNTRQYGVWLSTSQNAFNAKARAMYRCQRFSRDANRCYFDHCWLW